MASIAVRNILETPRAPSPGKPTFNLGSGECGFDSRHPSGMWRHGIAPDVTMTLHELAHAAFARYTYSQLALGAPSAEKRTYTGSTPAISTFQGMLVGKYLPLLELARPAPLRFPGPHRTSPPGPLSHKERGS